MIDFTSCRRIISKAYSGANGKKIAIEYEGEQYMLKFPPSGKEKPTELSYTNSCYSEHIGSSIFNMLGIEAQKTIMGSFTVGEKKKIVCACRDFTADGKQLYDFCAIKNTVIDSEHGGTGTELEDITASAKEHAARFLTLIDADAAAFKPLSKAYSVPKSDPERAMILSEASLLAASAPLDILKECAAVSGLLKRMFEICSRIMISDVGCAASLCKAAAECAAMNVYVNLPAINDGEKAAAIRKTTDELLLRCTGELTAVSDNVMNTLKEG